MEFVPLIPKIHRIQDVTTLMARAETATRLRLYEVAEMCLSRAYGMAPGDVNVLNAM